MPQRRHCVLWLLRGWPLWTRRIGSRLSIGEVGGALLVMGSKQAECRLGDAHVFALSHAAYHRSDSIGRVGVGGDLKVQTEISTNDWIIQMGRCADSN